MAKAKTTTGSKLMEKFAAMGFTIEPATAEHIKEVKANMSTEKPEIIEISGIIPFKNKLLKVRKMSATEVESVRMASSSKVGYHVNSIPTNKMIGEYDSFVVFDTIGGKTFDFIALSAIPKYEIRFRYCKITVFGKKTTSKSDLIINSVNMCESIVKTNTVPKLPKYAECTVDRKKADAAAKAKEDYTKRIVLNATVATRKPERVNIYSCKANTLETSIDYTKTDLKQLETLSNKKAKIENTLDTFELLEKSKIENEIAKVKSKAVKRTSKNMTKCSNKSLKEITDNAKELMKHNAELTATAKNMTSRTEYISYSKKFKKAFRNVVDIEYNENCLDVSAKLSALHEKQKALDEKRKTLKTKISACDSVISQLEKTDKNKINFSLIDSKLDVIGISLTEYSLTEVQAVKTSITTTLTNVNAKIGNILDDIKALTSLETTYTKIKTGKEIKIDVTTKSLDKNVYFSVVVGYDINKNNSTYAILHIRQLTEKTLEKIGLNECVIDVNYNVFRNNSADVKLALSRQITKRQSYNMIVRQGSKTQYNIYHCAMRNDFDDHDTSDIYSTAYTQITNTLSIKNAADAVKAKKIIIAVNSKIQHLNKYKDCHVIEKYVNTANRCLKDVYQIDFVIVSDDYNKNKSLVTLLENMYTAISEKSVKALKTSCYNAINHYLTSIRAIREKSDVDSLDSVIESETERFYTLFEDNQIVEYSEKSIILKMCYAEMKKCLNAESLKIFKLLDHGYNVHHIAEKMKIDHSTVSFHIENIRNAFLKCYADIVNDTGMKNKINSVVLFSDPSILSKYADTEQAKSIANTYNRNTEYNRIKTVIYTMSATERNNMHDSFKQYYNNLRSEQKTILSFLTDNCSDQKTANLANTTYKIVRKCREKTITEMQNIIEKYAHITIDKTALKKAPFKMYVDLFEIA